MRNSLEPATEIPAAIPATRRTPNSQCEIVPTAGKIPDAPAAGAAAMRILVVDDNGVNRLVAMRQLQMAGHTVATADNGRDAVAMTANGAFDCVLMDVHMPAIDGLEATRQIRARDGDARHLPIFAITADAGADERRRCLESGMDGTLHKPLDLAEAQSAIRQAATFGTRPRPTPTVVARPPIARHAGRMSAVEVERLHDLIAGDPTVRAILDNLPQPALIIGRYRQIVYANAAALAVTARPEVRELLGLRPGEALGCVHSDETAGGCGTTRFCATCGAARALRAAQRRIAASDECRIAVHPPHEDLNLRVWSSPIDVAGEPLTLFTLLDISDQKRREALERIFFHDVLNTAGGIHGIASMCHGATADERLQMSETVVALVQNLIDELRAQQSLANAENGTLEIKTAPISTLAMLRNCVDTYRAHDVARDRQIVIAPDAAETTMVTDTVLLGRVLGNMTKNALEASPRGGIVTLNCRAEGDAVVFSVHNPTAMPKDVQLQMFQRSFSTKGYGRGLGTYSMRLLSEQYLGGRVTFHSAPGDGTTFFAAYPLGGPRRNPED